jgi:hypothetical protein
MNDRPATVPFTPRSTANCLDLAVMYCGRQLPTFLTLWSCAAVPSCALVYVLTYFYEFDMRLPMLVIYVATTVLGGWLIAAVTPGIFQQLAIAGDEEEADNSAPSSLPAQYLTFAALLLGGGLLALVFGPDSPLAGIREELSLLASVLLSIVLFVRAVLLLWDRSDRRIRVGRPVLAALGMRVVVGFLPIICLLFANGWTIFLAIVFALLPGIPLAARYGFVAERACLTQLNRRLHHRGTDELIKSELGNLCLRLCGIAMFFGLLWMTLFFTLDILCGLFFQTDILLGRLGELDIFSGQFWKFLATDPLLLTTWTGTALLAYPFVRIAWFLCYIDLRVRRDCWDLELSLSREAARLKETA